MNLTIYFCKNLRYFENIEGFVSEIFGKSDRIKAVNKLYLGDCLDVLRHELLNRASFKKPAGLDMNHFLCSHHYQIC
ncbi:hypothetical protein BGP_0714 [Beggiatoa sp. PS]|nr:hypothetical protein BGP_0714 [Beggiatoa sp. PS]